MGGLKRPVCNAAILYNAVALSNCRDYEMTSIMALISIEVNALERHLCISWAYSGRSRKDLCKVKIGLWGKQLKDHF